LQLPGELPAGNICNMDERNKTASKHCSELREELRLVLAAGLRANESLCLEAEAILTTRKEWRILNTDM
jgi:hypothetical protein